MLLRLQNFHLRNMVSELSRALSTRERINSNQLWQFKWCEVIHRNDNDIDITRLQFIDILRSILLFNRDTVLIAFTLCKSVLSSLFLSSSTRGGLVRWAKNQKPYVWLLSFRVRPFGCYSVATNVWFSCNKNNSLTYAKEVHIYRLTVVLFTLEKTVTKHCIMC